MGKKRHFKGNNASEAKRQRREKEEAWRSVRGDEAGRPPVVLSNESFEAFYRAMHMVPEHEFATFLGALREPLPACFRIHSDYPFASTLREELLAFAGQRTIVDDKEVEGVVQLPWYPGGGAYKLGFDRRTIRKNDSLSGLHKWMVQHTDSGSITRQEAVSMVPPLALNVLPHHRCLDMCAAPGSKTSQLLETVGRSLQADSSGQQGVVVANDADTDRAYMLVHQCRRINSPLLVVTTHQGQLFPGISELDKGGAVGDSRHGYFDRVLCDVPCSGDGTLRKNPAIWSKWSTDASVTLHPLQLQIASRGFQLLKPGGLMVYSTCSLSPYEDEAVVAELLRKFRGSMELVDARDFIPGFRARSGLTEWVLLNDFGVKLRQKRERQRLKQEDGPPGEKQQSENLHSADEQLDKQPIIDAEPSKPIEPNLTEVAEVEEGFDVDIARCLGMGMSLYKMPEEVPSQMQRKFRRSLFPPSAEENEWMQLKRCMRCLPHDEDTGGFFVATLRKLPLQEPSEANKKDDEANDLTAGKLDESTEPIHPTEDPIESENPKEPPKKTKNRGPSRGLVEFVQWEVTQFEMVREYFGFTSEVTATCFFTREEGSGPPKSVYYAPSAVQDLLKGDREGKLKIVTLGVKIFDRKDTKGGAEYRLLQEGLTAILPFITRRKVDVTIQDFCNLLGGGLVSFTTLSAPTVLALLSMQSGIFISCYRYRHEDVLKTSDTTSYSADQIEFAVVCWRGSARAVNVMCGKVDTDRIKHQLEALGVFRPKILSKKAEENTSENQPRGEGGEGTTSDVLRDNTAVEEVECPQESCIVESDD